MKIFAKSVAVLASANIYQIHRKAKSRSGLKTFQVDVGFSAEFLWAAVASTSVVACRGGTSLIFMSPGKDRASIIRPSLARAYE